MLEKFFSYNATSILKNGENTLLTISAQLILRKINNEMPAKVIRTLVPYCLRYALVEDANISTENIENFVKILSDLAKNDSKDTSEYILKWIVAYYAPGKVSFDTSWKIDEKCKYALTTVQMELLTVREILYRTNGIKRINLAASSELIETGVPITRGELVRDKFPKNIDIQNHKFIPNEFIIWDGTKKSTFENRDDIKNRRVSWRFRFSLE